MKTYKNLDEFKKRVAITTDWADYFKLGGRMYEIYEYGGGWNKDDKSYVYFRNKRSNDMIHVEYYLPSTNYVDGKKVVTGEYRVLEVNFFKNMELWR